MTSADAPSSMEFGVLGPLLVMRDGEQLRLGGVKQVALLAVLLFRANQVVPTSALIDLLWDNDPPPTAQKTVQVFISRIRRELGADAMSILATQGNGYVLRVVSGRLDLTRAEALAAAGRAAVAMDPDSAAKDLRAALELWRGEPLSDIATEPFAQAVIPRLEELRLSILEDRLAADLAAGRHAQVVGELRQLIVQHPLRERVHSHLMVALYRSGRQGESLEVYRQLRTRLATELALEPGPELRQLEQKVLAQDPALDQPPETASPAATLTPAKLPSAERPAPSPALMTTRQAPRQWRWLATTAAVAVALVLGAVVVVTMRRGPAAEPPVGATRANSIVVISADGAKVDSDIPVAAGPGPLVVADGDVWVGNTADHTIAQISLPSGRLVRTYGLSDAPLSLTALGDQIWIGNSFDGTLSRILAPYRQLSAPFYPGPTIKGLLAVAADATDLWVGLSNSQLVRLDPDSLRVSASIHMPGQVKGITVVAGVPWTIQFTGNHVERLDRENRTARTAAALRGSPEAIASGLGSVWVATVQPNVLWRLSALTGRVLSSKRLQDTPTALAVGAGAAWVAEGSQGILERISTSDQLPLAAIDIGHDISGIAVTSGSVYLSLTNSR
jgi:DNA-binding SARP family transcriptional activator